MGWPCGPGCTPAPRPPSERPGAVLPLVSCRCPGDCFLPGVDPAAHSPSDLLGTPPGVWALLLHRGVMCRSVCSALLGGGHGPALGADTGRLIPCSTVSSSGNTCRRAHRVRSACCVGVVVVTSVNRTLNFACVVAGALDVSFNRFIPLSGMYFHVLI